MSWPFLQNVALCSWDIRCCLEFWAHENTSALFLLCCLRVPRLLHSCILQKNESFKTLRSKNFMQLMAAVETRSPRQRIRYFFLGPAAEPATPAERIKYAGRTAQHHVPNARAPLHPASPFSSFWELVSGGLFLCFIGYQDSEGYDGVKGCYVDRNTHTQAHTSTHKHTQAHTHTHHLYKYGYIHTCVHVWSVPAFCISTLAVLLSSFVCVCA